MTLTGLRTAFAATAGGMIMSEVQLAAEATTDPVLVYH